MATDHIQVLKLDEQGDLVVVEDAYANKSFKRIFGEDAIQQDIQVRILSLLEERILHPGYGFDFPLVETVFNENLVRGEMARTILEDPDVEEIVDFELTFEGRTRHASYAATVRLKDDQLIGISGVT